MLTTYFDFLAFLIAVLLLRMTTGQGGPSLAEYVVSECYGDLFSFDCGSGNRIRINRDFFGVGDDSGVCHYRSGDCIISNPKSNSLIHRFCTGRRACTYYLVERRGCNGYFSNYQQVEYQCVPDSSITNICSNVRYESENTYIASPNFPDNYPPNLTCSCVVTPVSPGVRVTMEILYLAIKYNSPCQDWLRVGRKRTCGTSSDLFTGSRIPIEFHSDGEESHSGFWLNFKASKPGEKLLVQCGNSSRFGLLRRPGSRRTSQVPYPRRIPSRRSTTESVFSTVGANRSAEILPTPPIKDFPDVTLKPNPSQHANVPTPPVKELPDRILEPDSPHHANLPTSPNNKEVTDRTLKHNPPMSGSMPQATNLTRRNATETPIFATSRTVQAATDSSGVRSMGATHSPIKLTHGAETTTPFNRDKVWEAFYRENGERKADELAKPDTETEMRHPSHPIVIHQPKNIALTEPNHATTKTTMPSTTTPTTTISTPTVTAVTTKVYPLEALKRLTTDPNKYPATPTLPPITDKPVDIVNPNRHNLETGPSRESVEAKNDESFSGSNRDQTDSRPLAPPLVEDPQLFHKTQELSPGDNGYSFTKDHLHMVGTHQIKGTMGKAGGGLQATTPVDYQQKPQDAFDLYGDYYYQQVTEFQPDLPKLDEISQPGPTKQDIHMKDQKIDLSDMSSSFFDEEDHPNAVETQTAIPSLTPMMTQNAPSAEDPNNEMNLDLLSTMFKDAKKDSAASDKGMLDRLLKMLLQRQAGSVQDPASEGGNSGIEEAIDLLDKVAEVEPTPFAETPLSVTNTVLRNNCVVCMPWRWFNLLYRYYRCSLPTASPGEILSKKRQRILRHKAAKNLTLITKVGVNDLPLSSTNISTIQSCSSVGARSDSQDSSKDLLLLPANRHRKLLLPSSCASIANSSGMEETYRRGKGHQSFMELDFPKTKDKALQVDMFQYYRVSEDMLAADHIVAKTTHVLPEPETFLAAKSGMYHSHKAIQVRPSLIDLKCLDKPEVPTKPKANIKRRKAVRKPQRHPSSGSDVVSPRHRRGDREASNPSGRRRKPQVPPKPKFPPMFSDTDMDIMSGSDRDTNLVKTESMASMPGISEMIFMPESEHFHQHVVSDSTNYNSQDSDWETRSAISL
ncbi:hypothetical protein CAPTEDRAFT_222425 [Capitella teleta]|uniref:CUB domain-containing protein n=1 Tax=Capitella teleta TaxID=283909 RepID=R7V1J4_CAPTE|nr:hypothetical protein CAPTEDRAFT_222425 [Capitella teleta]|eukprot:ELU12439.1 hypothetical protein CAPTEDRAFT_222425 [Capitella teleta]